MSALIPITGDLFPPQVPVEAFFSSALRVEPVIGDGMEPRLRGGHDFVLVKPTDRYLGEGTYLWSDGLGVGLVNVQFAGNNRVRLFYENVCYSDLLMDRDEFEECVLAIVVVDLKVRTPDVLRRAV